MVISNLNTPEATETLYHAALVHGPDLFWDWLDRSDWFTLTAHARLIHGGVVKQPGGKEVWKNATRRARAWLAGATGPTGTDIARDAFEQCVIWHAEVADIENLILTVHLAAIVSEMEAAAKHAAA